MTLLYHSEIIPKKLLLNF